MSDADTEAEAEAHNDVDATAPLIDLNADLGEGFGRWRLTDDEALLSVVTSANVACGFHASDPAIMHATVRLAKQHGVKVGDLTYPGFPAAGAECGGRTG